MTDPAAHNPVTAHQHALELAALGLRVLPIKPGRKHPPMNSWQHAATNETKTIGNWFNGLYRDCGVGLALGPQPCGLYLFAVDIDTHDPTADGWEALHDLEQTHSPLPDTWRSLTGAGGGHLIYSVPPGVTVRNQQASGNRIAPGIDVRGEGGQIVVAPTTHPDTQRAYAWEHDYAPWDRPVAEAPAWLVELVADPPAVSTPTATQSSNLHAAGTVFDLHRADWNWETELLNRGWTICGNRGTDTYWARPGKDRRAGHSAVLHQPDGPLVIFTTEMPPQWQPAGTRTADGGGWAFGPFGFYAATHHNGDRTAAAAALHATYGLTDTLDGLIAPAPLEQIADTPDQYDADLLAMLVDWHTFADTDHRAEEWLWEPIIAAKRSTAIFAPGGVGKSLIVLRLATDIVRQGHKVLYLDYEMTPDDLNDRLTEMDVDPHTLHGQLHYALLPALPAADTPEGGRAINRLAELVDAELVIIDTFARAVQGDENEADTVRQFYRQTGLHLKGAGRAFIRIDHAGKDIAKGQRGTSAKNDDVDVVWQLRVTDNGYQLISKKRRMGWVPETVNLTKHEDPFRLEVDGGVSYPPGTSEAAKILDELDVPLETSDRKAVEIYRAAGHSARTGTIRCAQKYRRNRSELLHFTDDLIAPHPVDNGVSEAPKSAPQSSGRGTSDTDRGAVRGAPGEDPAFDLLDGSGRTSGRGGARLPDADVAQCAPLKGAHTPSVTTNPAIEAFFGTENP